MNTLIASAILTISVAALAQFGLFYWRLMVAQVAVRDLSSRVRQAWPAALEAEQPRAEDFGLLATLYDVCPAGGDKGMGLVRPYYGAMKALAALAARAIPPAAGWARGEMVVCSRYAAVRLDQRLERLLAQQAAARSY